MDKQQKHEAKREMMELMQTGHNWQEAASMAGVQTTRSTAYRWLQKYRTQGETGLQDARHGHPAKVNEAVLQWLETTCRQAPQASSRIVQKELQEQFDLVMSITHLNRTRAAHGLTRQVAEKKNLQREMNPAGKKEQEDCSCSQQPTKQDCSPV